jgi:uncharacterized pyridoxal phosphate-containing UPF0001 family protein
MGNCFAQWAKVVHSLDSMDHAKKLSSRGGSIEFLLQVNLEPDRLDRGGVNPKELESFVESLRRYTDFLKIAGLMTVLPLGMEPLQLASHELARWPRAAWPALTLHGNE